MAKTKSVERGQAALDATVAPLLPELSDTDIANAKRLALRHGKELHFTPDRGWLVWDGRRWIVDEKGIQVQACAKETALAIFDEIKMVSDRDSMMRHAKKAQSRASIIAMIDLARSEPGIPARLVDFDSDPWVLNVANGTLDLKTGTLRPHQRKDRITNITEIAFEPRADCKQWEAFIWRITDNNEELYQYLQRLVGYLLVGDVSEQSLVFLYGTGANGKSVFSEVVMRLLGDYAIAVSPDLIMMKRHQGIPNDVARLRGARAAMMNETAQGSHFNEAKLKDLTGGDTLTGRFLQHEFFDFSPTHRIVIRGNHKPMIRGTDDGIWRRLQLVPFTVQIPANEQDRYLLDKLTAELPGILNWALQGCQAWQERGLSPPAVVTEAVQRYRAESDTLGRFIDECCDIHSTRQAASSAFYRRYREFVEAAGECAIPAKDMPAEMMRRGYQHKRTKAGALFQGLDLMSSIAVDLRDSQCG
jgi:putative DNA primase/helicase